MNKSFLTILIVAIYLFIAIWTFNHIEAWAGIGLFIFGLYIAAKKIYKKL